jgi:hypothetical protein
LASVGRQLVPMPSFFIGKASGALIIFLGARILPGRNPALAAVWQTGVALSIVSVVPRQND